MKQLEKKVLYNVLKNIKEGGRGIDQAPDSSYVKGLEMIGVIDNGWDVTLTALGHDMFKWLSNSIEDDWGL